MTAEVRLGPNDVMPCGTDTARRRHVALAEQCLRCGTDGRIVPLPTLAELVRLRKAAEEGARDDGPDVG